MFFAKKTQTSPHLLPNHSLIELEKLKNDYTEQLRKINLHISHVENNLNALSEQVNAENIKLINLENNTTAIQLKEEQRMEMLANYRKDNSADTYMQRMFLLSHSPQTSHDLEMQQIKKNILELQSQINLQKQAQYRYLQNQKDTLQKLKHLNEKLTAQDKESAQENLSMMNRHD